MSKERTINERVENGAKVMRMVSILAQLGKGLSLTTADLAVNKLNWDYISEPKISEIADGIDYCLVKGLVTIISDNEIVPTPSAEHIAKNGLLNAMGIALENISIVCDGELSCEDFLSSDNEDVLYAVLSAGLSEMNIGTVKELLLQWHCIRLTNLGTVITE
jgi:hypothetical protein